MAVSDAYVFPGSLTPILTQLFLQSHRLLFSHASAKVRGENTAERKVASTWDRTHNHQVMSPTRSPLSYPCWAHFPQCFLLNQIIESPLSIFLTSYLYLLLNWKSITLATGKRLKRQIQAFEQQLSGINKCLTFSYQHFLLFPQCFQKTSFSRSSKVRIL